MSLFMSGIFSVGHREKGGGHSCWLYGLTSEELADSRGGGPSESEDSEWSLGSTKEYGSGVRGMSLVCGWRGLWGVSRELQAWA